MAKKILFYSVTNGIDGMQKDEVLYASFDEEEIKEKHLADKNKNWNTLKERIIDVEVEGKKSFAKLNPIDKLLLGITN